MKRFMILFLSLGGLAIVGCTQLPEAPIEPPPTSEVDVSPTYSEHIQPVFAQTCGSCHGDLETVGLNLTTYEGVMRGSDNGPVILPGLPDDSQLVKRQREGHFGQLNEAELDLVVRWIGSGAPE